MSMEYVVSACLAGISCRYDGGSNPCPEVMALVKNGLALPLCPETLGGLCAPRPPCEQIDGAVICKNGMDLSEFFEKGAQIALKRALASGAGKAILKSRSPSCGFGQIYDGTFSRTLRAGNGLWAAKLAQAGFEIFTEENWPQFYFLG